MNFRSNTFLKNILSEFNLLTYSVLLLSGVEISDSMVAYNTHQVQHFNVTMSRDISKSLAFALLKQCSLLDEIYSKNGPEGSQKEKLVK